MDVVKQQPVFNTQVLERDDDVEGSGHFLRTQSRADPNLKDFKRTNSFLQKLAEEISEVNPELVQELDRIVKGKPELHIADQPAENIDIENGEDYDTDLEMDDEDYNVSEYARLAKHDTSGALHYIRCCEELRVVPVKFFLRHHSDTKFVMRYHGLGSRGAQAMCVPLERNTHITKLNLEGNDVESEGAIFLCKMLAENLYITELNLAENNITSEGVRSICELMNTNNRVSSLDLSGNALNDKDARQICDMLQKNTTLKKLYISYNHFGNRSGQVFKDALSNNDTLHILDLSWNMFRAHAAILISEGMKAQVNSMKENVGLKKLNLRMNGFGLEGAKAMSQALINNRTLMELDLSSNRIPIEGAVALGKGINTNDVLVTIKLGNNPITAAGAIGILAAVMGNENSEVQMIDLSEVYVSSDFMEMKEKLENERNITIIHGSMEADFKKKNPSIDFYEGIGTPFDPLFEEFLLKTSFRCECRNYSAYQMSKVTKKEYLKTLLMKNPITKIKDYMISNGLRLIDFFKQLDRDQSNTLTYDELKKGCERFEIDMSEADIMKTIRLLDTDKSGDIDFQVPASIDAKTRELMVGEKEHKLLRRALLKEIATLEEEERRKHEEDRKLKEAIGEDVEEMNFQGLTREEAWEAMEEVLKVFLHQPETKE